MNKHVLVKIINVFKYVLGPVVLLVVIWLNWHEESAEGNEVGIRCIFEEGFHFHWLPLTLAFVTWSASLLLTFVRWYVLVKAQDLPFTLGNAVQLGFVGSFFSAFLPGSVTGDIPKMVFMARDQNRRTVAVATIIIDRVIGLCGLIWLSALLGAVFWASGALHVVESEQGRKVLEIIVQVTWLLTAGSLVFWFLLGFLALETTTKWIARLERIPKLGHSLAEMCRATLMYRSRGRAVGLSLLLAMIGHAGFVLTFYFCSLFINPQGQVPSWTTHFLIVPVGMTFQAGMPTPGGMGFGEGAFGVLYAWVDGVKREGILASLVRRLLELVVATLGFILYWRMKPTLQTAPVEQRNAVAEQSKQADAAYLPVQ